MRSEAMEDVIVRGVYFDFFVGSSFCGSFLLHLLQKMLRLRFKPLLVQESISRQKLHYEGIDLSEKERP